MPLMFDYTLRGRICVPDGSKLNGGSEGTEIILPDGRALKLWEQGELRAGEDSYTNVSFDELGYLGVFYDGDCVRFTGPVEDGDQVWPPTPPKSSLRDQIAGVIVEGVTLDDCGYSGDAALGKADKIINLIDEPVTGVPIEPPVEDDVAVVCLFCHQNGEEFPAAYLAPQRSELSGPWDFVPVCSMHASGWWDGSDHPDGKGGPPLQPLVS
jgi:hypothetical protein